MRRAARSSKILKSPLSLMLLYNSGSYELLINHYVHLRGLYKSFLFLLFLFPVFVTSTALLLPLDSRHLPPPYCTHVLPLCLPTLPPHPRLRPPSITPSKPCLARINSLPLSSPRHSAVVSGPPTRPPCTV
jgi:hypothetical protein